MNIKKGSGDVKEGEMIIGKRCWRRKGGEEEREIAFTSALQPCVDSVIFHTARYRSSLYWSEQENICCVLEGCWSWSDVGPNEAPFTNLPLSHILY